MKFEHILKIYWAKGLYYDGNLSKLEYDVKDTLLSISGISNFVLKLYIKKFETTFHYLNLKKKKYLLDNLTNRKKKIINLFIAKIINIRTNLFNLIQNAVVRLYLIKCHRGKAQYLGKPSHGQRTWSNAWNAFQLNFMLKKFVLDIVKIKNLNKKIVKFNYKVIQKKERKKTYKKRKNYKKKINLWF